MDNNDENTDYKRINNMKKLFEKDQQHEKTI